MMALSKQIMPGPGKAQNYISIGGRSYSGSLGSWTIVPYQDGKFAEGNGWVSLCECCGQTADRPAVGQPGVPELLTPNGWPGTEFYDLTLNKLVKWDGYAWRDATGAVA